MSNRHSDEIDPVTGYGTTGHDWNGIKELNTPFPRIVIWALILTFLYSVVAWILLPAWPTGKSYTKGLLGLDQGETASEGYATIAAGRQDWMARLQSEDLGELQADVSLMRAVLPAAKRLFADNCAVCHGASGQGNTGFPVLADDNWLWSGEPDEIADIIRFGINSDHSDARISEMPSFDWMERADRIKLARLVAVLPNQVTDPESPASVLFMDNCAACHGDGGAGGLGIGAPSLTDGSVIYGQDAQTVLQTLNRGRKGVMPAWNGRLTDAEIKLLTLFVVQMGQSHGEAER
ncbi:cytochrome-c oxidase, cbb3-type subunit III [Roseibium sp. ROS1]|jgi:cytochrome c oxidase cbb3-type subunit III